MYSFEICNIRTGNTCFVFGYSWNDAVRRFDLVDADWIIIRYDYED